MPQTHIIVPVGASLHGLLPQLQRANRVLSAAVSPKGDHAVVCVEWLGPEIPAFREPYGVYVLRAGTRIPLNYEGYTVRDVALTVACELHGAMR